MAITSDDSTESSSASVEDNSDDLAEVTTQPDSIVDLSVVDEGLAGIESGLTASFDDIEPGFERNVEVKELLREPEAFDSEVPEVAAVLDSVDDDTVPAFVDSLADNQKVEPEQRVIEQPDYGTEFKIILESLQVSLATTQALSAKIEAVSKNTDGLVQQLNGVALNYELLTAEMETISSDAHSKSVLSKTFLIISSLIIASLVVFQIYMFTSLIKTERLQNMSGSSVLENLTSLDKKMALYDKNLTKALEVPPQEVHAEPHVPEAENDGHEKAVVSEKSPVNVMPVLEKLNRLRNGLPEKKLIRKESGDWFIYGKKSEECVADVDIVEALNESYTRIGRTLKPIVPLPQHNALCVLKPDGKGGTKVVMTKEFVQ